MGGTQGWDRKMRTASSVMNLKYGLVTLLGGTLAGQAYLARLVIEVTS